MVILHILATLWYRLTQKFIMFSCVIQPRTFISMLFIADSYLKEYIL